ncbi:MAG: hypothetical protein ACYC7A_13595 [Thermoanaerobaculia bacterium]
MRKLFYAAFLLCASVNALAQQRGDTKILLPVVTDPAGIDGAYGSIWATRLSVLNTGSRDVVLDGYDFQICGFECDAYRPTPPGITFHPELYWSSDSAEGYFLTTMAADLPLLRIELHVQDLSRQALTWGTEIPVVSEHEAYADALELHGIPVDLRFRARLRVYDFQALPVPDRSASVRYEVFAVRPTLELPFEPASGPPAPQDEPLVSGTLLFGRGNGGFRPGYAFLDLDRLPLPPNVERIRVRVTPITPDLRFWAFVSVTNNETQHVTTISP